MKLYFYLIFCIILTSCSKSNICDLDLSRNDEQLVEFFVDVALSFDQSSSPRKIKKWNGDINIKIQGEPSESLKEKLNHIMEEINQIANGGIRIFSDDDRDNNFVAVLGSRENYLNLFPEMESELGADLGRFWISWDKELGITSGHLFISIDEVDPILQELYLRQLIAKSLGLPKSSNIIDHSIFSENWIAQDQFIPIDEDLIKILYSDNIMSGQNSDEVKEELNNLFECE